MSFSTSSISLSKKVTSQRRSMATNETVDPAQRNMETEPLLGRPGDAVQPDNKALTHNLVNGTAILAQLGVWILFGIVWGNVLSTKPIILFHAHPLLNSAGIVLLVEAILIVQPTRTPPQKRAGTLAHAILNGSGIILLIIGLIIIEYNKGLDPKNHWKSVHAYLGVITYIVLAIQTAVGATMYFAPSLYGGVTNSKAMYKYHRMSGYIVTLLTLATVCAAVPTSFNLSDIHIKLWAVLVASIIILVGVVPRIRISKFGWT